jgi:hypothetical protein
MFPSLWRRGYGVQAFPVHPRYAPVLGDGSQGCVQHLPAHHLSLPAPKPPLRLGLGFSIERNLKLPNFIRGYYPVWPAIPVAFAPPWRVETSAPARRLAPLKVVQVHAFSGDSDSSIGHRRLVGPAPLCFGLEPFGSAYGGFPALTEATLSRRAVHADPAGALRGLRLLRGPLPAAFTVRAAARLSGCRIFEAPSMWCTFVTARLFDPLLPPL